jgi:hypothetical protein
MADVPAKSKKLSFKLTDEQCRMIEQRAERCKVSTSAWIRTILLQVATRPTSSRPGYLRIREPNGELT